MNTISLSMKSSRVFSRNFEVRSFSTVIPPSTLPRMIGAMGKFRRFMMSPSMLDQTASAQSIASNVVQAAAKDSRMIGASE